MSLLLRVANEHLRESYIAFCKQQGVRPADPSTFGKACTAMFGKKQRLESKGSWDVRRPPAYDVPTAEVWQERGDARVGIWGGGTGPVHRGVGVGIFALSPPPRHAWLGLSTCHMSRPHV